MFDLSRAELKKCLFVLGQAERIESAIARKGNAVEARGARLAWKGLGVERGAGLEGNRRVFVDHGDILLVDHRDLRDAKGGRRAGNTAGGRGERVRAEGEGGNSEGRKLEHVCVGEVVEL